jgi:hypothetical protein
MKLDLHVHTKYSRDSKTEPSAAVQYALKLGLDGIAVVDHGTVKGGLAAKKVAPKGLSVIVGSEIKTDRGEVIGYFLNQEITEREFPRAVDEIRSQGGIAVVSHPYDPFRPHSFYPRDEDASLLDGVEVLNSRCLLERANKTAMSYARKHDLLMTAGSDAHTLAEIGTSGVIVDEVEDIRRNGKARIFGRQASLAELFKARLSRFL